MANTKSTKKNTKKGNNTKTTSKTTTKKTTTKKATPKKTETKKTVTKKEPVKQVKPVPKKEEKVEEKKVEVKKVEVKEEKKKCPKKAFVGIIIAVFVVIALIILSITIFFNKERKITNRVKDMGVEYYTNYYYDALSKNRSKKDLKTILSRYTNVGIKVSLENMEYYSTGKYKKEIATFKSKKKKCDKKNTRVIIYPQKPYGKTDYKVKIELDCGF